MAIMAIGRGVVSKETITAVISRYVDDWRHAAFRLSDASDIAPAPAARPLTEMKLVVATRHKHKMIFRPPPMP